MKKTPKKQRISCIVLLIIFTVFVTMFANEQSVQAYSKKEWDVIKYTNQYRMEKGRSPLMLCSGMQKLSNIRKKEVAQYYSHTRPSGESCFSIIGKVSFYPTALGENIASGFKDSQKVVEAWIGSKGHRKNILGQSFFSWDCHHIVYWLVTPPLTGWKSNAVRLLPTAKNSRTI